MLTVWSFDLLLLLLQGWHSDRVRLGCAGLAFSRLKDKPRSRMRGYSNDGAVATQAP